MKKYKVDSQYTGKQLFDNVEDLIRYHVDECFMNLEYVRNHIVEVDTDSYEELFRGFYHDDLKKIIIELMEGDFTQKPENEEKRKNITTRFIDEVNDLVYDAREW